jgi:hypothetical protein
MNIETEKDKELWKIAKKRVGFKRHLGTYIIVNSFLWVIWIFDRREDHGFVPWPLWPMLGWGIGLAFNYISAYLHTSSNSVEKEFEKLKNKS